MTTRALPLAALAAAAIATNGCSDPYASEQDRPDGSAQGAQRRPAGAPIEGERPGRVPARARRAVNEPRARPARTPRGAAIAYATAASTWTARTVAARYRRLAAMAVGQARRDAQQTAVSAASDPELGAGSASSRASASGALSDHKGCLLVVVDQQITPESGQPPRRQTAVYRACVRAVGGGYAVERFDHL